MDPQDPRLSLPAEQERSAAKDKGNGGQYLAVCTVSNSTLSQLFRIKCERYIFLKKCVRSSLLLIFFCMYICICITAMQQLFCIENEVLNWEFSSSRLIAKPRLKNPICSFYLYVLGGEKNTDLFLLENINSKRKANCFMQNLNSGRWFHIRTTITVTHTYLRVQKCLCCTSTSVRLHQRQSVYLNLYTHTCTHLHLYRSWDVDGGRKIFI